MNFRIGLAGALMGVALLAAPASAASPAVASASTVQHVAITGAECTAARKAAHESSTTPCVETITRTTGPRTQIAATAGWTVGQSWVSISAPFGLWSVKYLVEYRYNGSSVWEIYQSCTGHAILGVGLDIQSCYVWNDGGGFVNYMVPVITWKDSLTFFSSTNSADWRIYVNGYYCCVTATHG